MEILHGHNLISETNVSLADQLGFSPSFCKDSDDEVATEQLTLVVGTQVDVTDIHATR